MINKATVYAREVDAKGFNKSIKDYCQNVKEFINITLDFVNDCVTEPAISFSDVINFPQEQGIYVVYYMSDIVYIGKTTRTFSIRCEEHTRSGSALARKISSLFNIGLNDAGRIIMEDLEVKFIELTGLLDTEISNIEMYCIMALKPLLNLYQLEK